MIIRLALLFLIFSLNNSFSLLSQNLKDISEYEFEKYGVEQGTAMNASNTVYQDKLGYIWIGSQSGMDRFDGYEFTNFANITSDSSSTNLKWVNSITEDSKGNIWATDQMGNISKYDRFNETWDNYDPVYKESLTNIPDGANIMFYPQPRSIIISPDDRYAYVGIFGFGLIRIDSETKEQKYYEDNLDWIRWFDFNSAHRMVNEIEWIDDTNILVATGNGLRIFNTISEEYTKTIFSGESNDSRLWVSNFEKINNSEFFLSTGQKGILKSNIKDEKIELLSDEIGISQGNFELFYNKKNEELWVNIENVGVDVVDLNSKKVIKLREDNSALLGKSFNNIIKDDQDNIWISSNFAGVLKYDPNKKKFKPLLRNSPKNMGLGIGVIWGLEFDDDGNIWAGSREPGGGIVKVDLQNNKTKLYNKKNNDNATTYTIFKDNIGSIWAFEGGNLLVKRKNENTFKNLGSYNELRKDENQINRFFDPYMTYSGDIIFPGQITGWIVDKDGNGRYEEYKLLTERINEPLTGFHRIDSTNTYIVSDRSVFLWNELTNDIVDLIPNEKEKLKKYLDSYQHPGVFHEGKLYFGTYGNGMLFIDLNSEDIGFITSNDGLPNMYLYNMFKDEDNNFWMSSNQGIIKYNPYTKKFRQYTPTDGVQDYEFNSGTADVNESGFIAMGGLAGINYFNPENISENSIPPKVIIQNINVGGVTYKLDAVSNYKVDEIKFQDNSLSFEYVAFNFRNTQQNKYKYKMEGYDKDWIAAEDRRFVSYTNLPIGSYTFRVQGSNNDGVWNEEGASYKLTILPPWYRTYFAYASYVLLLAFGFRSFGKYQAKKSLEQADNERRAGELEEAKKIQESMLPKVFPSSKQFDVSAGLVTSTEIGGDYYDFFEKKDTLYAVCGDATGHGTASGMMVSIIKSGLNGLPALSTNKVLYELNNIVKKIDLGTLKMSLNICEVTKNSITLSSAAMPPIYLYNSKSKKTEEILIRGLPLGGLKNETFEIVKRKFNKGDVLVLLSDGLPEAENDAGELYDYERVIDLISKNASKSAEELKSKLIGEVDIWLKGGIPDDDVTIVVIKKN